MKNNPTIILPLFLFFFLLLPVFLPAQDLFFFFQIENVSSTQNNVNVFVQKNSSGTENFTGFTVDFYYDNTESTLTAFDYTPLTNLGWAIQQTQTLHFANNNPGVSITHTGFGTTNVFDDNFAGISIGTSPVHILTINFDNSIGTSRASEGFMASTTERPAMVYIHNDGSEYAVVVTGQQIQSLPVEWQFFRVSKSESDAQLEWATASELHTDYFEIQHSVDGRSYEKIGQIKAAGFSSSELHYSFLHERPASGINYYRLKQYDLDGSFDYSTVESVYFSGLEAGKEQLQVYPNPASEFISLKMPDFDDFTVELIDLNGRTVSNVKRSKTLNVSTLLPGVYYLKVLGNDKRELFVAPVSIVR